MELTAFDIEKAKEGKKVVTRDGREVRIVCYDKMDDTYPIVALVDAKPYETEMVLTYTEEGRVEAGEVSEYDLFILDESEDDLTKNNSEKAQEDDSDWQSFRAESAKDILCALLNGNVGYHGDSDNEMFVSQSIGIANELCKQLKLTLF